MEAQSKVRSIADHIKHYLETRTKLFMLNTAGKASSIVSSIVTYAILAIVMTFVLLFLSVGAALWIGHAYGETSMGFLFVGLFYLLIMFILFAARKSIIKVPVTNSFLTAVFEHEKD
jgi:hypothetical protein